MAIGRCLLVSTRDVGCFWRE